MGICLSRFLATRPTSSTFMYMFTRTAFRTCNAEFAHLMPHSVGLEAKQAAQGSVAARVIALATQMMAAAAEAEALLPKEL